MRLLAPALLLLAGCPDRHGDTGEPAPWSEVETTPLDPYRLLIEAELTHAVSATRVYVNDERQISFVLDPGGGQVLVLDRRYHHSGVSKCVDTAYWEEWFDPRFQGRCEDGEVELNRGLLDSPDGVVAAALGDDTIWLFSRNGGLFEVDLRLETAHPFDLLRVNEGIAIEGVESLDGALASVAGGGELWLAEGARLWRLDTAGALIETVELPGAALDLRGDRLLTAAGLWTPDGTIEIDGTRLAVEGDATWVADPASGLLRRLDAEGAVALSIDVPGLTGPVAVDPSTGRAYAAVAGGVAVIADGAVLETIDGAAPIDLAATAGHEIVALLADGTVEARFDEQPLVGGEPLDFVMTAFVEKPRTPDENLECFGFEDSVDNYVANALVNRELLDDLPAPTALGVTPHAARRIRSCNQSLPFSFVWNDPRTEVGVLFHDQDEACADPDCHVDFLASELGVVSDMGAPLTWSSGLSPYSEQGVDPLEALLTIGAPDRYLFYGLGILPEISQFTDPRGKEPYPLARSELSRAVRAETAAGVAAGGASAGISLYPGDTVAAFSQGGCANLLVYECIEVGVAGAWNFDDEDLEVLDLLLHRALAARPEAGPSTWSFHLPDLGPYVYTDGCEVSGRRWSGEECVGARLQDWQLDLHQRFVLNDVMRWSLPSELAVP